MAGDKGADVLGAVIATVGIIAIVAIAIGVRLLMTGGDWACVFAEDVPLCVAVSNVGK